MKKNNRGFTLIELLVVVLIIGILAAIALPQYQKSTYKARTVEAITIVDALTKAQEIYYLAHDEYSDDISKLDITIDPNLVRASGTAPQFEYKYTYKCSTSSCSGGTKDRNLPSIEFTFMHNKDFPNRKWCVGAKSDMALTICQSLGTWDPRGYQQGPYYLLK